MAGKSHDFSQVSIDQLATIVKDVEEDGQWGFFDWVNDLFMPVPEVQESLESLKGYHKTVIDKHNIGKRAFDEILKDVENVDKIYENSFTNTLNKLELFQYKLGNTAKLITPSVISTSKEMFAQVVNNKIIPTIYKNGYPGMYDKLPPEFKDAIDNGMATIEDFQITEDGFIICMVPLSDILKAGNVDNASDYNDQYLFCIKNEEGDFVFSTCKLRTGSESGETSSVAISFVSISAIEINKLFNKNPNMTSIDDSIYAGGPKSTQSVADKNLLNYFQNPKSNASYLLSEIYVEKILSSATKTDSGYSVANINGGKALDDKGYKTALSESEYDELLKNPAYNNQNGEISISDINNLSEDEFNAILVTHSANIDKYSFAAEVQFHADFAEDPIWLIRDSAIKSDMGIGESENYGRFGPNLSEDRYKTKDGDLYKEQLKEHAER